MATDRLIGVDIGTQGTKAGLFDADGTCLAEAFQKSELLHPAPGVVEEDPETQLDSACATIRECLQACGAAPGSVAALAVDGQMAGIMGIGADGRNVTPYDSWLDTRCAPYIARMKEEAGQAVLSKTGGPPSFNHGPKILWWMHERPEVFRRIRAFVPPGAYAAMRLCGLDGGQAFIDTSYLHFSGFADTRRGVWDEELCRQFGLDPRKLPAIVDPQRIIGELAPAMAGRCGLKAGTPVAAGCGDTAASFLSCGATEPGICVDVAGTASVFATTVSEFRSDTENGVISCARSACPGLWHPYAYINGGGMNLEWFRGLLALPGLDPAGREVSLEALDRLLENLPPAADDPIFIPHLGGRVCPSQPFLRGAWTGLSWDHGLPHLYRAILEGVALEYGVYLRILARLYAARESGASPAGAFRPVEIRVTGGGSRSRMWNRIKADAIGIPAVPVARREGAPLGSALLAGFGVGLFADLHRAAAAWSPRGEAVRPDEGLRSLYQERLDRYAALLEALDPRA
jgi:xylulokinase